MISIYLHLYFIFIYKVGNQTLKDFAYYAKEFSFNYEYTGEVLKDLSTKVIALVSLRRVD